MSAGQYVKELIEEKSSLNPQNYSHAIRLLEDEIYRMRISDNEEKSSNGAPIYQENRRKQFDEETVEISEKIIVPVNKYPNYNFVGKLLGPKGSTLKAIQVSSKTKISILGRGSSRDKKKEEEFIESCDPKYEHLKEPLHILIRADAPKSQAHTQVAAALEEVQKYLIPDNDKSKYGTDLVSSYQEEIVKISEKIILPTKEFPRYNFVGKLLGPKGNILKSMQSVTQTKIIILGRGSTREKDKEDELIQSNDPKYKHLKEPLHVLIQVEAPRSEAHSRIAAALNELKKYIEPANQDTGLMNNMMKDCDVHLNFRGQTLPVPIIRVGIPPPGSIILGRPLPFAGRGTRLSLREGNKH